MATLRNISQDYSTWREAGLYIGQRRWLIVFYMVIALATGFAIEAYIKRHYTAESVVTIKPIALHAPGDANVPALNHKSTLEADRAFILSAGFANHLNQALPQGVTFDVFINEPEKALQIQTHHANPAMAARQANFIASQFANIKNAAAENILKRTRDWASQESQAIDKALYQMDKNYTPAPQPSPVQPVRVRETELQKTLEQKKFDLQVRANLIARMLTSENRISPDILDLIPSSTIQNLKDAHLKAYSEYQTLAKTHEKDSSEVQQAHVRLETLEELLLNELKTYHQNLLEKIKLFDLQEKDIEKDVQANEQESAKDNHGVEVIYGQPDALPYSPSSIAAKRTALMERLQHLTDFQKKLDGIESSGINPVSIHIPATKDTATKHTLPLYSYILIMLCGAVIGVLLLIYRYWRRPIIMSVEQLEAITGKPCLQSLPKAGYIKGTDAARYILQPKAWRTREAIHALHGLLTLDADKDNPFQTVMITSSYIGEGKTTLAAWLGRIAADSGRKTIIVDCDMRRPNLHTAFDEVPNRTLNEYLQGKAKLKDIIHKTDPSGVHTIYAGPNQTGALNLIRGQNFEELIETLREEYEFVILDSPAHLPVFDATAISRHADITLYNVMWNYTSRHSVLDGKRKFDLTQYKPLAYVLFNTKTHIASLYKPYTPDG